MTPNVPADNNKEMHTTYKRALWTAAFLSLFMTCITNVVLPIPSETIDSPERVQLVQQGMHDLMDTLSAPPSMRIMTNFSWPNGLPVMDAWTPLPWFRQLHTHRLVTMTWLVVAPLQLASLGGTRLYSRAWHRRLGCLFAVSSTCIALGLMEIIVKGRVYGHPHWLAMVINVSKVTYFVASLILALTWYSPSRKQHAHADPKLRQQQLQHHEIWILRHVAMGYTVAFQRFLMFVVGPLLHATLRMVPLPEIDLDRMLTSMEIQQWYNVTSVVAVVIPMMLLEKFVIQRSFFSTLGNARSSLADKRD